MDKVDPVVAPPSDEVSLVDLVAVVARRRRTIALVFAFAFASVALVLWLPVLIGGPVVYRATAKAFFLDPLDDAPGGALVAFSKTRTFAEALTGGIEGGFTVSYDEKMKTVAFSVDAPDPDSASARAESALAALARLYAGHPSRIDRAAALVAGASGGGILYETGVPLAFAPAFEPFAAVEVVPIEAALIEAAPIKTDLGKELALAAFVAAFIALLAGFLVETVDGMRHDPVSKAKLRSAWRRERWTEPGKQDTIGS